ncbi:PHP domain-containing protein [Candidatus Pacearchaeota archaeon]|nr:PHP domain-containing protein [Candidatus Pacearchaeota archaeon]
MIDLHIHSTASDGELSPEELVDLAIEKKISVIAITDHEVVWGSRKAIEYARGKGVEVVPGIEIGDYGLSLEEFRKLRECWKSRNGVWGYLVFVSFGNVC